MYTASPLFSYTLAVSNSGASGRIWGDLAPRMEPAGAISISLVVTVWSTQSRIII